MPKDIYLTIEQQGEPAIFKDRKSKFIAYTFPAQKISDVKLAINKLKKEHHSARHWCYAYRIGIEHIEERANDDGEPSNSAGMPILNQIKALKLTNILVIVVRYFGGTKLGVGGLINAYKTATQMALNNVIVIKKIKTKNIQIIFEYNDMNKVMRIIKEYKLDILEQNLQEKGKIILSIRLDDFDKIKELFIKIHTLNVKVL